MTIKKIYNRLGWVTGIDAGEGIMMRTLHYADAVPGFTPCFNGNISVMDWSTGSGAQKMINRYRYTYDNLNCIIATDYETLGQSNTNNENFSTYYTYDLNCIITTLRRYGKSEEYTLWQRTFTNFGLIDDLSMTYNGNQLKKVTDQADELTYAGSMDFKDGANKATEYTWDANGNMTKDQNKGLTSISYNRLNLPARIVFQDGHVNYNTYSYDGRKLATTYKIHNVNTVDPGTPFPLFPNGDDDDLNTDILNGRGLNDSITVGQDTIITWDPETTLYTRYYSDNYIHRGNRVERILTPNGFMASDTLFAYIKDHQGNVRAVIDQTGRVMEVNHYYPYGMLMTMLSMANEIPPNDYQPYKYGSKELNRENGLDLYDSYARWYDPALPGTTGQDPKAEDYTPISPYTWCAANPIRNIDNNGKEVKITFDKEKGRLTIIDKDIYNHKLPTQYVSYNEYKLNGIRDNKGNLVANQALIINGAFSGGLVNDDGEIERDLTKNPEHIPIPNGQYDLLEYENPDKPDWFKVDPIDELRYDDHHQGHKDIHGETRHGYRLHRGTRSLGCITVSTYNNQRDEEWRVFTAIINRTSKSKVPKREGLQKFVPFTKRLKYGTVTVTGDDSHYVKIKTR